VSELPLISVIIPTYERVKLTLAAVQSVLEQSYPNYEIIVIDDGSSESVLSQLKNNLPTSVTLLSLPHSGLPAIARNAGINQAKGEWIAFLDSDDLWNYRKLEFQIQVAIEEKFDCISADFSLDSSTFSGDFENIQITRLGRSALLRRNIIVNSSVIVRKNSLEAVGGIPFTYNVRGVEDYATWLRLITLFRWGHINCALGTYVTSHSEEERISSGPNPFNHLHAIIDFLGWLRSRGNRLASVRIVLRLIPRSIRNFH
jgi:glycosyltransferase involved in cell wall biosynthesis